MKALLDTKPAIKYYSLPNPGFSGGHNFATSKFQTSGYRIFLNPDIVLDDNCLVAVQKCFNENPEVVMVSPRLLNIDGTEQNFIRNYPGIHNLISRILGREESFYLNKDESFFNAHYMHGAFFIIDKEINKDVVKLDERYFLYLEDIDFCILMQNYGKIGVATLANATHKHD